MQMHREVQVHRASAGGKGEVQVHRGSAGGTGEVQVTQGKYRCTGEVQVAQDKCRWHRASAGDTEELCMVFLMNL